MIVGYTERVSWYYFNPHSPLILSILQPEATLHPLGVSAEIETPGGSAIEAHSSVFSYTETRESRCLKADYNVKKSFGKTQLFSPLIHFIPKDPMILNESIPIIYLNAAELAYQSHLFFSLEEGK